MARFADVRALFAWIAENRLISLERGNDRRQPAANTRALNHGFFI